MKFVIVGTALPTATPEAMQSTAKALLGAVKGIKVSRVAASSDFRTVFAHVDADDAADLYKLAAAGAACIAVQIHPIQEFTSADAALGNFQKALAGAAR